MTPATPSTRIRQPKRVVISGTYSTGKTTTATALALATGLPLINALSAREILTDLYPGRRFQDMSAEELLALGLRRFEERCRAEAELPKDGSFVSDGSVLNEWVYATVRRKIGINPGAAFWHQLLKAITSLPYLPFFGIYTRAYGRVAKLHAAATYTDVVHLPIEFDMANDGHRPVSERYRRLSDRDIYQHFTDLGLPVSVIGGNQEHRVELIAGQLGLNLVMPVKSAVKLAHDTIAASREAVSQRIIDQTEVLGLAERVKLAIRF